MKYKRIGAYLIDSIIISFVVTLLASITFLNPTVDKYNDAYDKYNEISKDITASEQEVNANKIIDAVAPAYYDMQKNLISKNIIEIFCILGYFVLFNVSTKGQTLGKKIFKIRIKTKNGEAKWYNYLIRYILLNEIWVTVLSMLLIPFIKNYNYYIVSMIITYIGGLFVIADVLTMLFRKDERSLHDIISNTIVE